SPGPVTAQCRQPSAPVAGRAGAHALTELPRGLLEQLSGAPVEDDPVSADHVVDRDLFLSVAAGHLGGIGVEPGGAFGSDPSAFARRGRLIDFVLAEFGIALGHDDTVVLGGAVDGDVAVDGVFVHLLGRPGERIAEASAAGAGTVGAVAGSVRDFREGRAVASSLRGRELLPGYSLALWQRVCLAASCLPASFAALAHCQSRTGGVASVLLTLSHPAARA